MGTVALSKCSEIIWWNCAITVREIKTDQAWIELIYQWEFYICKYRVYFNKNNL